MRARLPSTASPAHTYVALRGAWAFLWFLAFTLSLVYQVDVVGLNPFQLILVGTVLEVTCFLAEIPTGVVADLRSRKLSVTIGLVTIGIGICLIAIPALWAILLAQLVWGVGYTFVSGAVEAWITDEIGDHAVQPVLTRGHQVSLGTTVLGILTAGLLGQVSLALPIVVGGAGFVLLGTAMALLMGEEGFSPTPPAQRDTWSHVWATTREGLRTVTRDRVMRTFLLVGLLAGLTSEVLDRLWVDRIVHEIGLPSIAGLGTIATWFALFALVSAVVGLLCSLLANRVASTALTAERPTRALALLVLVEVAGVIVFALAGSMWLALSGRWTRDASQAISWPVARTWINRTITNPATRATTLSMIGQADAVGQVLGGPALGALASRAGVQTALLLSAAIHAPAAVLFARLRSRPSRRSAAPSPGRRRRPQA